MRFNSTVSMTEANTEKRIMKRQPTAPPRGRILMRVASIAQRIPDVSVWRCRTELLKGCTPVPGTQTRGWVVNSPEPCMAAHSCTVVVRRTTQGWRGAEPNPNRTGGKTSVMAPRSVPRQLAVTDTSR